MVACSGEGKTASGGVLSEVSRTCSDGREVTKAGVRTYMMHYVR